MVLKVCDTAFGQDLFRRGHIFGIFPQPVPDFVHGHDGGHAFMDGPDGAFCVSGDDDACSGG